MVAREACGGGTPAETREACGGSAPAAATRPRLLVLLSAAAAAALLDSSPSTRSFAPRLLSLGSLTHKKMDNPQEEISPMERDLEFLEVAALVVRLTATGSPSTPISLVSSHGKLERQRSIEDGGGCFWRAVNVILVLECNFCSLVARR